MPQVILHSIICNVPDEPDKDEIMLFFKGNKIWPKKTKYIKIGVDDKVDVNIKGTFNEGWIEIELWDFDFTSRNDHLGTFHLDTTASTGHYGCMLSTNTEVSEHADYILNWEILG
ncbi:MAG: hypothetical protein Tsb0034_11360 [Ekhidna sp.]